MRFEFIFVCMCQYLCLYIFYVHVMKSELSSALENFSCKLDDLEHAIYKSHILIGREKTYQFEDLQVQFIQLRGLFGYYKNHKNDKTRAPLTGWEFYRCKLQERYSFQMWCITGNGYKNEQEHKIQILFYEQHFRVRCKLKVNDDDTSHLTTLNFAHEDLIEVVNWLNATFPFVEDLPPIYFSVEKIASRMGLSPLRYFFNYFLDQKMVSKTEGWGFHEIDEGKNCVFGQGYFVHSYSIQVKYVDRIFKIKCKILNPMHVMKYESRDLDDITNWFVEQFPTQFDR